MESPIRVQHKSRPAEPWAEEGAFGFALRTTPAARMIPAQAYVNWGDYFTWEKLTDLIRLELDD